MKNLFLALLFAVPCIVSGQNLPQLKLKSALKSELELIGIKLEKGEICVMVTTYEGWIAYDTNLYYTFRSNGTVEALKESVPKAYLKNRGLERSVEKIALDSVGQKSLSDSLNSKATLGFLQYSQQDFTNKLKKPEFISPCVSDANGYRITFIQNNRLNSYAHYAPKYYLTQCKSAVINTMVMGKFVKLLELWKINL